ncbi:MAG: TolC family protein [Candidatus Omnitrophica bacterium]|nr:TolC family protein [Candidatus Omnitrophota bacterium]
MKKKYFYIYVQLFLFIFLLSYGNGVNAQEESVEKILSFGQFIARATADDTEFEQILIDELTLKYQKDLKLPAKDLVLSVKQQHEFYLHQDRSSPDTTIGLSKLFPYAGTELEMEYQVGASRTSASESGTLSFTFAQPIAENAFGRSTRLLDKIVGLEVDVAGHQIVEAYEDYLATIITAYYNWYEDYQNLLIGQSSYKENLKLLDSMSEREKQKIALPIDVNKVRLQVLSKKERLITLEEQYQNSWNAICRIIRQKDDQTYIPQEEDPLTELEGDFRVMFDRFTRDSRTFAILKKLEDKSSLEVARDADELLPSINIIAGYEMSGDDYGISNEDGFLYAGLSLEWPLFSDQVAKAEYEVSQVLNDKQKLSTLNTYHRLYMQLLNLFLQIEREQKLMATAQERITLAQSILEDEKENYSFGKVTLNDYIQAFNDFDNNRFNKITHDSLYKKLLVEWLRLNDLLVNKATGQPPVSSYFSKNME